MSVEYMKELLSIRLSEAAALISELERNSISDPELAELKSKAVSVSQRMRVCRTAEEEARG